MTRGATHAGRLGNLMEQREEEYNFDRGRIRAALEVSVQDLNAAHKTTSRHCGDIGLRYLPGETTEADILRVPVLSESEAARSLDLKNGPRLKADGKDVLKVLSAALCAMVSAVAWGALVCGVNLKRPLASIPGAIFALILGVATAVIVWRFLARLWSTVGSKEGASRPMSELRPVLVAALVQSGAVLAGLMALDGLGLIRVNAAKAELNPLFAIPLWLALVAAGFINLAYVSGMAYTSRAEGYNETAGMAVSGLIADDEAHKQEARKQQEFVKAALDGLGQVRILEQRIEGYRRELKQVEDDFNQAMGELYDATPEVPSSLMPEEDAELRILRDRVTIAKERYDAHLSSRGVNHSITQSATGTQEQS